MAIMINQDCYSPESSYASMYTPPPKRPFPSPLQRSNTTPRPTPLIITSTPPAYSYNTRQYSPIATDTPPTFYTPARESHPAWRSSSMSDLSPPSSAASSPGPITPTRIFMGGIVSPRCSEDEWDEKLGLSIDVPAIVLTEPTNPARSPSPPPKSILLLPPTSLSLPSTDPTSPTSPFYSPYSPPPGQLYSPAFAAIVYGESQNGQRSRFGSATLSGLGINGVRTLVFGMMMLIGGWHLWLNISVGGAVGHGIVGWGDDGVIGRT